MIFYSVRLTMVDGITNMDNWIACSQKKNNNSLIAKSFFFQKKNILSIKMMPIGLLI